MLTIRLGCGETITEDVSLPLSVSGMKAVEEIRENGKKQNMKVTIRSTGLSVLVLPSCINGMEQDILSVTLKLEEPGSSVPFGRS